MRRHLHDRLALGLLVACSCLVLLTFRDYGITWDEPGLRTYGGLLLDWYRSGFADDRAWAFGNLRYYGGGFDMAAGLLEPLAPLEPYPLRHLLGGLIGLLGLALAWRLARRVGGPRAGLLALLLLATLPGWWGHMFFNSKDVPFAVAVTGCLLAIARILERWPRPRPADAALLGLALGLALGVRAGGVLIAAYLALPLLPLGLAAARARGLPATLGESALGLARLLPGLPVLVIVLVPAWPWIALDPGHFLEAVAYLGRFPYLADTIFLGRRYPAPELPAAYWPTLLAFQLTEIILLGAIALLLLRPAATADPRGRAALLAVATAALLPLAYAVLARPTGYNALRHFIFVLPPLAVLAALGLDRLLTRLGTALWLVVAAGLLLPVARMAQLHPYQYVYFNDLSGGLPAAAGRFELDYWGTSLRELGREIDAAGDLDAVPVPVRICGPFEAAQEVLPARLRPVRPDQPAGLAATLAIFFCVEPPPEAVIASVQRLGVTLSRAFRTPPDAPITDYRYP